jgi:hypothetical protein
MTGYLLMAAGVTVSPIWWTAYALVETPSVVAQQWRELRIRLAR